MILKEVAPKTNPIAKASGPEKLNNIETKPNKIKGTNTPSVPTIKDGLKYFLSI